MITAPSHLDKAKVLAYAVLDDRQLPTGKCRHVVGGIEVSDFAYLAICQYDGDDGFYLFYCGVEWKVVTDTFHFTMDEARDQAEMEYQNISSTWVTLH